MSDISRKAHVAEHQLYWSVSLELQRVVSVACLTCKLMRFVCEVRLARVA